MAYNKPEVTKGASAIDAIQSQGFKVEKSKARSVPFDATLQTYEVDE